MFIELFYEHKIQDLEKENSCFEIKKTKTKKTKRTKKTKETKERTSSKANDKEKEKNK